MDVAEHRRRANRRRSPRAFSGPDQQRLRIKVLAGGFNLNWIELSPVTTGPIANGTYKFLNAASALAMDLSSSNTVVTTAPSSSNKQQWILRHIGGGQYRVSPAAGGNSWDRRIVAPLAVGMGRRWQLLFHHATYEREFYRLFAAGSGSPLSPLPTPAGRGRWEHLQRRRRAAMGDCRADRSGVSHGVECHSAFRHAGAAHWNAVAVPRVTTSNRLPAAAARYLPVATG